jgi:hypothetical protein
MRIGNAYSSLSEINSGAKAPRLVISLPVIHNQLRALAFTIYSPRDGLEKRQSERPGQTVADTIEEFLRNEDARNEEWQIPASDLTPSCLVKKITGLEPGRALALNSKCTWHDGSSRHVPMMDFKPRAGKRNLQLIRTFLQKTGREGVLLESGESYHFFGFEMLDQAEWVEFMGHCLLAPYSDTRWIGHSLVSGTGALRITRNKMKPKVPFVRCKILRSTSKA